MRYIVSLLLLFVVTTYLFSSCSRKDVKTGTVVLDTCDLRNGDLVFRNGYGYESRVVTDLSAGEYSHVGITYHNGAQWCVIHAVPGEAAKGEKDFLKCDPIGEFFRHDRAKTGARVRVVCADSVANAATAHAYQCVCRKVPFDKDYDLEDTSSLYCTELIRLVYLDCGIDLCEDRWHRIPLHTNGPVIFPEDIWESPLLTNRIVFETIY